MAPRLRGGCSYNLCFCADAAVDEPSAAAAFSITGYGAVAISPRGDSVAYEATTRPGGLSRLVIYADEGHGPRKPADQIDVLGRSVSWFDHYLAPRSFAKRQ